MPEVAIPRATFAAVRAALLERREIALLDVREEAPHAEGHPLFAANLPLSRLELDVLERLPRRSTPIITLDDAGKSGGYAERAARKLAALGYTDVAVLADGIAGWRAAGGELFRDVNVPSKAFGELVDATAHPPSLTAEEVRSLLDANADVIVVDVRRFDEYQTMSIPTGISVPGAELALRLPELAPNPQTQIIVNCAGRTRSIIGAQSLINFGLPNPVAALRNGTIGWLLVGQTLEHGQTRRFGPVTEANRKASAEKAKRLAQRAGVRETNLAEIENWKSETNRTTYRIDVRTPREYEAGHLAGFVSVPGGQLVQETEMSLPVRGARVVLMDTDGVRANMTSSWLAQMDWEVYVLHADPVILTQTGATTRLLPPLPTPAAIPPAHLRTRLDRGDNIVIIDLALHADYRRGHIPGAWYVLRAELSGEFVREKLPAANFYVLTSPDGILARFAHADLLAAFRETRKNPPAALVLEGGTNAWKSAGFPLSGDTTHLASPLLDRYHRPYEGTNSSPEAMQAYLDWEFGLVEQLRSDGTHHFRVL
ncbi:MAG: rhodanese-related sulfurtransferase [Zoogloeaceae bacterium]|jgi:rhodanese-related sulfurtransferase|nr:rhodanese-related sulfurtransferase [Zoogloeaceae bacterium]